MSEVVLAYIHPQTVGAAFADSIMRTFLYERMVDGPTLIGVISKAAGPTALPEARNEAVEIFLETDGDWLWFVDSDISFAHDSLANLVSTAETNGLEVLSGLYYGIRAVGPPDARGVSTYQRAPHIYRWDEAIGAHEQASTAVMLPPNSVIAVDGVGAGCLLLHRSVLTRLAGQAYPHRWFDEMSAGDGKISEDLSFCRRVRDLGVTINVHTGVQCAHQKHAWY